MQFKLKKFEELTGMEVYNILGLRNEVFIVEQNCPYLDCDHKDENSYHLFFEEKDEIIAYLRILERGLSYDEVSIGRVLVKGTFRKKGIAKKLMLEAIAFIKNGLKEDTIRISAQEYLIKFYSSIGFKSVSEIYLEDDIPHQEMLLKI